MTLTFHSAAAEDEPVVVAHWTACRLVASYNDPSVDFRFAKAGLASDVLVGRNGSGEVKGAVMVGHDGHRGWVYYVAADPGLRGQGLGREAMAAAEAWLRERGVAKVQLMVRETNTRVVAFYERLGFEVTPRAVMAKWLDAAPKAAPARA